MNSVKMKLLCLSGFVFILVSSCLQSRYAYYMQNKIVDGKVYKTFPKKYKVQPHDILYIRITGSNQEVVEQFNMDNNMNSMHYSEPALYIHNYLVNDSGYIVLPVLGKISVIGDGLEEIQQHIQMKIDAYIKNALAIVKLVGFKISIFGEVQNPGVYSVADRVNIFELISRAGDITVYGNKKKALLIRETGEGSQTFTIDLTDNNIIASDFYYLQPNDIIYVKPVRTKALRQETSNITGILSVITALILVVNFFR